MVGDMMRTHMYRFWKWLIMMERGYAVHSYSLMSVDFQSGHPPGSGSN